MDKNTKERVLLKFDELNSYLDDFEIFKGEILKFLDTKYKK